MPEEYVGAKFKTVFVQDEAPQAGPEIFSWAKKLHDIGAAPSYETGSAGNLSYRTESGFITTASHSGFATLSERDLVEVVECDPARGQVCAAGVREPSSETLLHHAIYQARPDINVIFHFHDQAVLDKASELGIPITAEEKPYGTIELADQVKKALNNHSYILMRNHGSLVMAKTMQEAGQLALEMHKKATSQES